MSTNMWRPFKRSFGPYLPNARLDQPSSVSVSSVDQRSVQFGPAHAPHQQVGTLIEVLNPSPVINTMICALLISLFLASATFAQIPAGPGDRAFAEGDFARAVVAYETEHQRDPKNVHVLARLGDLAFYSDKLADAERYYKSALALDSENVLAKHALADIADRRDAGGSYRIDNSDETAILPFVATDPLPIIKVRLSGGRDAYFLIDTGAPRMVIDYALAKSLGLKIKSVDHGVGAGGMRISAQESTLNAITLGNITIHTVPVILMPMKHAPAPMGMHVQVVIGATLLYHFLATLDYTHAQLILRPRMASAAFERRAEHAGDSIVPLWYVPDHFLFAKARVNTAPAALFNIDTGGEGIGLQASQETVKAAGLTLDLAHPGHFSAPSGER